MTKEHRLILRFSVFLLIAMPISGEPTTHVVERGQTIYSIARRYGVPQAMIIAENDIADPRSVPVGTVLVIPGTYRVNQGDSYYGIARRFGVELDELLGLNDRAADTILREGDVLVLPPNAGSISDSPPKDQDIPDPRDMVEDRNADVLESNAWPLSGSRAPLSGKLPGVMIRGSIGDEVRSVAAGRVRYTGTHSAFGRVVMVQSSEGYLYVYGGTGRVIVRVGDLVAAGAVLAVLGDGPHSNEPALYFSVFKGSEPVRPEDAPRG